MGITLNYVVKRIVFSIAIVLGISIITYIFIYLAPGDPAYVWAGRPRGPLASEAIAKARVELGLDQPIYVQFSLHVFRFFSGNWGLSIRFRQSVFSLVMRNFASTLELLLVSFTISIPIGLFLGIYSSLYRGSRIDAAINSISIVLSNTPRFWIGLAMLLAFTSLNIPTYGRISDNFRGELVERVGLYLVDSLLQGRLDIFLDVFIRIIPPALALSLYPIGAIARVTRISLSEALQEEFVREAVSLGLPRNTVVYGYALRGLIPSLVQAIGLFFSYSLIEAMAVEYVFGREGLGNLLVKAIPASDFPLVTAALVIVALVYVITNTMADIVQASINPRVTM